MSNWREIQKRQISTVLYGGGTAVYPPAYTVRLDLTRQDIETLLNGEAIEGYTLIEGLRGHVVIQNIGTPTKEDIEKAKSSK